MTSPIYIYIGTLFGVLVGCVAYYDDETAYSAEESVWVGIITGTVWPLFVAFFIKGLMDLMGKDR